MSTRIHTSDESNFRLSGDAGPATRRRRTGATSKEERLRHAYNMRYSRCRERVESLELSETEKDNALRLLEYLREGNSTLVVEPNLVQVKLIRTTVIFGRQFDTEETAGVLPETARTLWNISFIRELVENKEKKNKVDSKGKRPVQQQLFGDVV